MIEQPNNTNELISEQPPTTEQTTKPEKLLRLIPAMTSTFLIPTDKSCGPFFHCQENVCKCQNGTPNPKCLLHDSEYCSHCNVGFHLENDNCVKNHCSCDNGDKAPEITCTVNDYQNCASCTAGYDLVGKFCKKQEIKESRGLFWEPTEISAIEQYCGKSVSVPGLIFHINLDKSEGSKYAEIAKCASGLLQNLPMKTVATIMFMPSPYDFANTESMNSQNTTGSNEKTMYYINEVVRKVQTEETSQGNYDIDNTWYVYMLNMIVDQYFETENTLYNPNNLKHTVQLTFTDQQDDLQAMGINTDIHGSNFNSNIVVASSGNMNSLTDSTENFIKHDWSKTCDQQFYTIMRKTICASVVRFEKINE